MPYCGQWVPRQPDPLYGGQRGGPAYYIHVLAERKRGKKLHHSIIAVLFAISGLICWCGISQVISNSVSSAFANAFSIPPIVTTVVLVVLSAVIVLRKDATVKSLDVIVPIMAVCYFVMTVIIIAVNFRQLPAVLGRIFSEAFGLRQVAAGGFGAVLMNGVKRGLFSNEAGSGSAPCAAAAASCDDPVKMGFVQALGVLIDTVVICSCTAFMMLLAPANVTTGLTAEAIRLIREIRPRAVMLENVRGFLDSGFEEYRDHIFTEIKKLGYVTHIKLLNASDYGVPQLRPRVVIVGIRKDQAGAFEYPQEHPRESPTVGETLCDLMSQNGWKGAKKWAEGADRIAPTLVGGSKKHGGPR